MSQSSSGRRPSAGSIGPPCRAISISSSLVRLAEERIDPFHARMRVGVGGVGSAPELISDSGRGGGVVAAGLAAANVGDCASLLSDLPEDDRSRSSPDPLSTRRMPPALLPLGLLVSSPTPLNRARSASFSALRREISICCCRMTSSRLSFAVSSRAPVIQASQVRCQLCTDTPHYARLGMIPRKDNLFRVGKLRLGHIILSVPLLTLKGLVPHQFGKGALDEVAPGP